MATSGFSRSSTSNIDARILIGIIADAETTIGFLLAGIGEAYGSGKEIKNFMIVTEDTQFHEVEHFFLTLYTLKNVGVILIGSEIFKSLYPTISRTKKITPIILELPTRNAIIKSLDVHERIKHGR